MARAAVVQVEITTAPSITAQPEQQTQVVVAAAGLPAMEQAAKEDLGL